MNKWSNKIHLDETDQRWEHPGFLAEMRTRRNFGWLLVAVLLLPWIGRAGADPHVLQTQSP
jgi:hypothetical protein